MTDIPTILGVLNSIKTATDITKLLREADLSLEKAEYKMKLADLMDALTDAKFRLAELQEIISEKDKRLLEIEEAFEKKDNLIRAGDAYYSTDKNGNPIGHPYCLRCWENDHKQRQLVDTPSAYGSRKCPTCGQNYFEDKTWSK